VRSTGIANSPLVITATGTAPWAQCCDRHPEPRPALVLDDASTIAALP